jgi:alpha-beta hydrolase superfamily lysophospholipase
MDRDEESRAGDVNRRAPWQWSVRSAVASPRVSFEELEIRTSDGATLRALVVDPPEGVELRATLVLAHAMNAKKTAFGHRSRPGLSSALAARGFRTVAFDFRGHGDSTEPLAGSESRYDDLVQLDLPAVVDCVRARGEGKLVVVVGHSLGGHVALAAQGTGTMAADAIVTLASNVWLRELEPSRVRWGMKRALARTVLAAATGAARMPKIPALERLRAGRGDASTPYVRDVVRSVTDGTWMSRDGSADYLCGLANVKVPVGAVLGDRDRMRCHPSSGEAFVRRCAGRVAVFHAAAGHMELVTSHRAWPAVLEAVEWAVRG